MSFFKTPVRPSMLGMRLSDVHSHTTRTLEKTVEGMRTTGAGEQFYKAVRYNIEGLVTFAIQFAIKTYLKPQEAEAVLKCLFAFGGEEEYYWQRFSAIPENRGAFSRGQIEYMMAGNALLDQCGKTGTREIDDLIRQFGADAFTKVCEITKKEIKSVRLDM